jgi:hypothetical protein
MSAHLITRRIALLCLSLVTVSASALEASEMKAVSLNPVLNKECGIEKNESFDAFRKRPLAWCPFDGTRLTAGTTAMAALAGRRLYLVLDLDPRSHLKLPLSLTMTTFDATGQVRTHLGMFYQVTGERLEASIYVPDDAASVYWTLSGGAVQQDTPALAIRDVQTFVSDARFRPGQMCTPCSQYLDEAIERVRKDFLFATRMQLDDLAGALRLSATGAQNIREMDGPMKELSRKLSEATLAAGVMPHGSYQTKAEYALNASSLPPAPAKQGEADPRGSLFDTKLLHQQIGYVQLKTFQERSSDDGRAYARSLRDAVLSLRKRGARQWIVDLREHAGGTLFPPIAALRPLLGNAAVGYFVDASEKPQAPWLWGVPGAPAAAAGDYFSGQDAGFGGDSDAVALLLGPVTASSGEMLAIAFHGRPHTRSFGTPTAGYTTAVSGAPDRHGNSFGFVAAYSADRNKQRIYPKVVPDLVTEPDAALGAAINWLGEQQ